MTRDIAVHKRLKFRKSLPNSNELFTNHEAISGENLQLSIAIQWSVCILTLQAFLCPCV